MSVHETEDGRYRVAWREGGKQRTRRFDRKGDAYAFDEEVRRTKQLGPLATQRLTSKQTLNDYVRDVWGPRHVQRRLATRTARDYHNNYVRWIEPAIGDVPINMLTAPALDDWLTALASAKASPQTQIRSHTIVSSILQHATKTGVIAANPMRALQKPRVPHVERDVALRVEAVEEIRAAISRPMPRHVKASKRGQRKRAAYTQPDRRDDISMMRDAALVSVLAYCGLRPSEACALQWSAVGERRLTISAALDVDGTRKETKGRRTRTVRMPQAVRDDLDALRAATSDPISALVFPRSDGKARTQTDQHNWSRRVWHVGCRQAGEKAHRLYDLRHLCASLLIVADGQSAHVVARQLGNAPSMTMDRYAHDFDDHANAVEEEAPVLSMAEQIKRARAGRVLTLGGTEEGLAETG